jgi:hypothetical protein
MRKLQSPDKDRTRGGIAVAQNPTLDEVKSCREVSAYSTVWPEIARVDGWRRHSESQRKSRWK